MFINQRGGSHLTVTEEIMKNLILMLTMAVVLLAGTVQAAPGTRSLQEGKPVITPDPTTCPNPERYVLNQDIFGMNQRLNRFLIEMYTSVSGEVQTILPPDRVRIDAYIQALENYRAWMVGQNFMDYPGTYKLYYCLPTNPNQIYVANEQIRDLINQTLVWQGELYISQSSRLTTGLLPADDTRLVSYMNRMKAYLTEYADLQPPPDYPRSTEMTRLISGEEPR